MRERSAVLRRKIELLPPWRAVEHRPEWRTKWFDWWFELSSECVAHKAADAAAERDADDHALAEALNVLHGESPS